MDKTKKRWMVAVHEEYQEPVKVKSAQMKKKTYEFVELAIKRALETPIKKLVK